MYGNIERHLLLNKPQSLLFFFLPQILGATMELRPRNKAIVSLDQGLSSIILLTTFRFRLLFDPSPSLFVCFFFDFGLRVYSCLRKTITFKVFLFTTFCEIGVNLEEDEEAYDMSSSDNDSTDSEFQGMLLKSYVMFF